MYHIMHASIIFTILLSKYTYYNTYSAFWGASSLYSRKFKAEYFVFEIEDLSFRSHIHNCRGIQHLQGIARSSELNLIKDVILKYAK